MQNLTYEEEISLLEAQCAETESKLMRRLFDCDTIDQPIEEVVTGATTMLEEVVEHDNATRLPINFPTYKPTKVPTNHVLGYKYISR